MPQCKDCAFFDLNPDDDQWGKCRRNAPRQPYTKGYSPFPEVHLLRDWCGEFNPRPEVSPGFDLAVFQGWLKGQDEQGIADLQVDEDGVVSGILHLGVNGLQRQAFIIDFLMGLGVDPANITIMHDRR